LKNTSKYLILPAGSGYCIFVLEVQKENQNMKRLLFTTLVLTALLSMTVGTAFAGSALELVSVQNNGGGPTFTFRVNGEFSPDELSGSFVQVEGGDNFPLYCAQTAPDEVVCHASKKIGGKNVVVGFGGARFWTDVPEQRIHQACYPVYDANTTWPTFPTVAPGFVYWTEVCTEEQPVETVWPVGPIYYLGDAPSGWGNIWLFFENGLPPAYPPQFEFITPGYYKG
jgi:hypothetical protein